MFDGSLTISDSLLKLFFIQVKYSFKKTTKQF